MPVGEGFYLAQSYLLYIALRGYGTMSGYLIMLRRKTKKYFFLLLVALALVQIQTLLVESFPFDFQLNLEFSGPDTVLLS